MLAIFTMALTTLTITFSGHGEAFSETHKMARSRIRTTSGTISFDMSTNMSITSGTPSLDTPIGSVTFGERFSETRRTVWSTTRKISGTILFDMLTRPSTVLITPSGTPSILLITIGEVFSETWRIARRISPISSTTSFDMFAIFTMAFAALTVPSTAHWGEFSETMIKVISSTTSFAMLAIFTMALTTLTITFSGHGEAFSETHKMARSRIRTTSGTISFDMSTNMSITSGTPSLDTPIGSVTFGERFSETRRTVWSTMRKISGTILSDMLTRPSIGERTLSTLLTTPSGTPSTLLITIGEVFLETWPRRTSPISSTTSFDMSEIFIELAAILVAFTARWEESSETTSWRSKSSIGRRRRYRFSKPDYASTNKIYSELPI